MTEVDADRIRQAIKDGGQIPPDLAALLTAQHPERFARLKRQHLKRIGQRLNGFPKKSLMPPLSATAPRQHKKDPPPQGADIPPPLVCFQGWKSLGTSGKSFTWGSDEQPSFGPVVGPAEDYFPLSDLNYYEPGTIFHKWSAMTIADSGEFSLAIREESPNGPEGYEPEETEFFGYQGSHVQATIGQLFYIPDFAKSGASVLQALARIRANHVMSAVAMYSGKKYSAAGVFGFATTTLAQGFPVVGAKESEASSSVEFLDCELGSENEMLKQVSLLDDPGYADTITTLKWDGYSDLFFVYVNIAIYCVSMYQADTPCGSAVDLRFGWDDRLAIYPDGISEQYFPASCPLQLDQISLCGF